MPLIPDRDLFDFLEQTADAALTVNDAEICFWNSGAEALFGFRREEVIGKTCFELFRGRGMLGTLVCTEHCQVRDCAAHHRLIPDFDLEVKNHVGRRALEIGCERRPLRKGCCECRSSSSRPRASPCDPNR